MSFSRLTAEKILEMAKSFGADAAEVFLRSSTATVIEVKEGAVDAFERARDLGAGLRVIADGRMGFAFATEMSDEAVSKLARSAVTNARNTESDPFQTIPDQKGPYASPVIYDGRLAFVADEEKIERVLAMEREAFAADKRITRIRKAQASFSESETMIANSHGAFVSYRGTACSSSIEVVAEEKGESQAGWDFDVNRFYTRLEIEEVGRRAARRAAGLLGARRIDSVRAPVLLENHVAAELLSIIASGFSAENVQKHKSLFAGRMNTQVFSTVLTVYDDGGLDAGLGTAPCDDEAVPMSKKTVISNGTLLMYLYNSYAAKKDGVSSTGNAVRGGFKGLPGVGATNLYIEPGRYTHDDMLSSIDRGLFVTEIMGSHTANPISGDFSVGATGFWIEKGRLSYPVREATIAGNLLDLMKNVISVGSDLRFTGRIGSPSLLVKDVSIGGR